jgi:polyhydroxyalkanoate synthesis regulator phasin
MAETDEKENPPTPDTDNPNAALPETNAEKTSEDTGAADYTDLGQKIVDIALGAAVVTGELTVQVARLLVEQGPQLLDTLEAKGRPVREQIDTWLKNSFSQPFQEAAKTDEQTPETESAEDEISALERRVRELETQISRSPVEPSTPAATVIPVVPDLEDNPVPTTEETSSLENTQESVVETASPTTDAIEASSEVAPPTTDTAVNDTGNEV